MRSTHRIYVGTIGEGLWRSLDGGETFMRGSNGMFVECHVRALAAHPRDPNTLYLGSELGLFRTTDGADHWDRVSSPLDGRQVWSILFVPSATHDILVGTCPARLFRSSDGGKMWNEPEVRILQDCPRIVHTRVTTLAASPDEPEKIWAGVEIDGLFRSRDRGATWQAVGRGLSSRDIHALAIVPGKDRSAQLLAATNNDLNVSEDDGETWRPLEVGQSLPWSYCRALAQPIGKPDVILLGSGDGPPGSVGLVARSTDGGARWHECQMPGRANSTIWTFAVHPADPELIYAASVSGEIYRSIDAGASWEKLAREFGEIRALAWTP